MREIFATTMLMATVISAPASSPVAAAQQLRVGQEWQYEGKTTRATFERLSKRGQEWGDWQEQEEIAQTITAFRRDLRGDASPGQRSGA